MYYQNYEDYIRRVLGYPIQNNNNNNMSTYIIEEDNRLEELYPEIYNKIESIIDEMNFTNNKITKEEIDSLVEAVYKKINTSRNNCITNNIYDLAGNCWEWTQEAYSVNYRAGRGRMVKTEMVLKVQFQVVVMHILISLIVFS